MTTTKFKKTLRYILADEENLSLENRLYLSAVMLGILICIVSAIIVLIISPSKVAVIANVLLLFISLVLYWFAKFKRIIEPFKIPIIITSFIGIFTIWVFDGGINGPDMMIAFVALMLALIIIPDRTKKYIISFFISLVTLAYLIQLLRPDLIVEIPSETNRWFDSFLTAIYCSVFIFIIVRFVHKHYAIEKLRAEESERKFRIIYDKSPDMYYSVSPIDAIVINCNETLLKNLGFSKDEVIGKPIFNLYDITILDEVKKTFEQFLESGNVKDKELIVRKKDGSKMVVSLNAEAVRDDNQNFLFSISSWHDITGRKQAELKIQQQNNELKKLNADKDRFMSILGHDLRGPFSSIIGFSELLSKNLYKYDIEKIEYQIGIINNMSKQTYNLLEDLLMWAKSQAGKLVPEPKTIYFIKICEEIVEIMKSDASAKNITLNYFSTGEINLWADENMFKTILRNLVSNAIKFTNPNGRINVYAEKEQNHVVISVSDNGVGIAEEDIPKLWDITAKYSNQGTANEKGTGLGLSLCKEFVDKHGGKIWVESEVGKGSDFRFIIPLHNNFQDQ